MMLPRALLLFSLFVMCLFAFICSSVVYIYCTSPVCSCSMYGFVCDVQNDQILDVLHEWLEGVCQTLPS